MALFRVAHLKWTCCFMAFTFMCLWINKNTECPVGRCVICLHGHHAALCRTYSNADFRVGLCDMDKKYISRFFDFFFDFDFNHDFDTNRHALSYTSCFCTSYLSCTSCFALFFILLHILLFISFFTYIYIYICSCVVLLLYNFYSLHCPLSGPDLIYISLLIIPCMIYHVTNKETLTFTVINAFCVNLKHISKGNQLDLSQKVVTCL